jgi:hypothetical protein
MGSLFVQREIHIHVSIKIISKHTAYFIDYYQEDFNFVTFILCYDFIAVPLLHIISELQGHPTPVQKLIH